MAGGLMVARGLARRCPVCGQSGLFTRWFTLAERCPRCHLRFERIEGHWLGAVGLNTIVSFVTLFIVVVTGLILSHPDYEMTPLLTAAASTAVLVPLAFYPSSKTTWTAIDILMRPLQPGEAKHPTQPSAQAHEVRKAAAGRERVSRRGGRQAGARGVAPTGGARPEAKRRGGKDSRR